MKLSGNAALDYVKAPNPPAWAALLFCQDDGVASDAAAELKAAWEKEGPSTALTLSEDEIARDPAVLFERLEARSLLGERNIITVRLSSEKLSKYVLEAVSLAESSPGRFDSKLLVIAGALKKASKLRTGFEGAKAAASLQFFADNADNSAEMIRTTLNKDGLEITDEGVQALANALPGHRRLARMELEKVGLYGRDLGRAISLDDIMSLCATDIDHALPSLVSAALLGDSAKALGELDRLDVAGVTAITVLRGFQRETERLLAAHTQDIRDARSAGRLRPPVWNDHWPQFQRQMRAWPPKRLVRLLARIHETEAMAKESGQAAKASVRRLIADIVRLASQ